MEMNTALTTANLISSALSIYLHYPTLPLRFKNILILRHSIRQENCHSRSLRVLYHHLRISAQSPLIPSDRFVTLTIDNILYKLTDTTPLQHTIHLFVNSYKGHPSFSNLMKISTNSRVSGSRSVLLSPLPYLVLKVTPGKHNTDSWCALQPKHRTWVRWFSFRELHIVPIVPIDSGDPHDLLSTNH